MNSLAVAVMVGLQLGHGPAEVWRSGRRIDLLQFVAPFLGGLAVALTAVAYPWWPVVLAVCAVAVHLMLRQGLQLLAGEQEARAEALQAREEAAAAVRVRGEFFRVAAHELRTPLTSLRGYAQLMRDQMEAQTTPGPARQRRAFEVIDRQTDRLARTVAQLLDASRLQQGELRLERRPTDVAAVVGAVVAATRPAADRRLVLESTEGAWAAVDAKRLEQVVQSLLEVALRYSQPGETVRVGVGRTTAGDAELTVEERGAGVPEEFREHVLRRFARVENGAGPGALGLGLYVSRHVVAAHGGTITVETPAEGGNRFVVTLPGLAALPAA